MSGAGCRNRRDAHGRVSGARVSRGAAESERRGTYQGCIVVSALAGSQARGREEEARGWESAAPAVQALKEVKGGER
jgi:hypothetical protein